ncbi:hypothetical protein FA10DRAFT_49662 [Acaromyces ingoldii]|uniref:Uncharacterized protein n=1 Tax=Acaromyces ingoldii TaxID=215250 RepID=A0A316YDB7_9BASI|nr:hypothetical protein FA10DRAFT_49662 [Acaromyces ingoldii]PWN86658.1 hypothetical protein FA10DRAFT_49662 [Acaromyces ingoldii]
MRALRPGICNVNTRRELMALSCTVLLLLPVSKTSSVAESSIQNEQSVTSISVNVGAKRDGSEAPISDRIRRGRSQTLTSHEKMQIAMCSDLCCSWLEVERKSLL